MDPPASSLALAVPDGADAEARSRAFRFPYPVAYDVQLQLMAELFRAIEERRAGVFESPTGTVRVVLTHRARHSACSAARLRGCT